MKSKIGADYALNCEQLSGALKQVVAAGDVAMVWGPPGIGKSAVGRQVAEDLGREYIDVRANLLDPVEVHGMPYRDEESGAMRWAPPAYFPLAGDDGRYLVCLDELSSAPPATQAALYQVLLDRQVGEHKLADGVALMACGNEEGQGAVAHRMGTATANRLRHLYGRADAEAWQTWAVANDVAVEVLFFLMMRPDMLHDFDPKSRAHAFPSPRSWVFVSNGVKASEEHPVDAGTERALYAGTVGEGAGTEFYAFLQVWRQLPNPQEIIDSPQTARIPEDPSAQIALCGALMARADDANFDSIVTYADRQERRELGEFLVTQCVRRNPELQYCRAYVQHTMRKAA